MVLLVPSLRRSWVLCTRKRQRFPESLSSFSWSLQSRKHWRTFRTKVQQFTVKEHWEYLQILCSLQSRKHWRALNLDVLSFQSKKQREHLEPRYSSQSKNIQSLMQFKARIHYITCTYCNCTVVLKQGDLSEHLQPIFCLQSNCRSNLKNSGNCCKNSLFNIIVISN